MKIKPICALIIVLLLGMFTACTVKTEENKFSESEETEVLNYTVTFDSDGGTQILTQTVKDGEKIVKPQDPTKEPTHTEEYTFIGWYVGEEVWNFETDTVQNDMTLVAKYSVKKSTVQYK